MGENVRWDQGRKGEREKERGRERNGIIFEDREFKI
jgi:hypothetical protein